MPGSRLVISNFKTGFETDRTPININNDAFPVIINAYVWRGRILKKPGTVFLGRLQRAVTTSPPTSATVTLTQTTTAGSTTDIVDVLNDTGVQNPTIRSIQANAAIVPGTVTIDVLTTPAEWKDTAKNGTLTAISGNAASGGTINYATGEIILKFTVPDAGGHAITVSLSYFPDLPVMGLEDFETSTVDLQTLLSFDTTYSYQITQPSGPFYSTSFYKSSKQPIVWSAPDSQQFWSENYANAIWVTNFKDGFHFVNVHSIADQASNAITMVLWKGGVPFTTLVTNDVLWFNEGQGAAFTLNGVSGTITDATGFATGTYIVTFAASQTVTTYVNDSAIAQLLTNSLAGQDGIRWYDGDPTGGTPPLPTGALGWVNFSPPLSVFNAVTNPHPEYLVGALAIMAFKDRLLFFAPSTQTSVGSPVYFQDRAIYSWNGTPYYSASPIPAGQVSNTLAWIFAPAGSAGYQGAGLRQQIISINNNEDVLLVDFEKRKTKLVYTGNDVQPFLFYSINSELGAQSTFSGISLDTGAISIGNYGIAMTTQYSTARIDLVIPDQVFQIDALNAGVERVNAVRDFRNEYIFWAYPTIQNKWKYPTRSFLFNYRDNTWSIIKEAFTHHGLFQKTSSYTWGQLGAIFGTWNGWKVPWGAGRESANFPNVIGGNQQGFVLIKTPDTTNEAQSNYIKNITVTSGVITINSPNHCMEEGDYVYFTGVLGTANINTTIRQVSLISTGAGTTFDPDNFTVDNTGTQLLPTGTYTGGGVFARLALPFIQTKQFPIFWEGARQVRIGTQWYLFDRTAQGQCSVQLYLNQNPNQDFNESGPQGGIIYTQTILTTPESTDPSPNADSDRIWHRMPQSLIGDTVQIAITLSDAQMRNLTQATSALSFHAFVMDLYPAGYLAL